MFAILRSQLLGELPGEYKSVGLTMSDSVPGEIIDEKSRERYKILVDKETACFILRKPVFCKTNQPLCAFLLKVYFEGIYGEWSVMMGESGGFAFYLPVLSTSLGRGPVAGENVFLTKVTGPDKVILQTMIIGGFAAILAPFFEKGNK